MKHKSLTDSQSTFDDSGFSLSGDQLSASFVPSFQPTSTTAMVSNHVFPAVMPSGAAAGPAPDAFFPIPVPYKSVPITSGGITINLLFDVAAQNAPESFREGIEQAATLIASTITNKITVNLKIDYSGTGGGAAAEPDDVHSLPYLRVAGLLAFNGVNTHGFWSLPNTQSIQGYDPDTGTMKAEANVNVTNAEEKVWGLIGANDTTTDDGQAFFTTDIDPTLLAGVALHELTHALGRAPTLAAFEAPNDPTPDVFDLFRFTSPGVRLFQSYNGWTAAPPAYFSVDGGVTKLADYGQYSDPSDFLNTGVQGNTDAFDEYYNSGSNQFLTAVDLEQLTALGFNVTSGLPVTVVDVSGNSRLDQVGLYYYLDSMNAAAETGPLLKYDGAPVFQGEFQTSYGTWKPIGAEQAGPGYQVAWRIPGTDFYSIWFTDFSGNLVSTSGTISGIDWALESAEVTFQQDLNGDGVIGLKTTLLEAFGSTKLDQVANNYFLDPVGGGQGPTLKYQGGIVVTGEFSSGASAWSPIAAEQTATGYIVAWKLAGTDTYTVWSTDANGNYIANIIPAVSGSSSWDFESIETTFKQDLNGDGVIGIPNIEAFGATRLDKVGANYFLDPVSGGQGPTLKYQGAPVVTGQFVSAPGVWSPIAAEKLANGGYDIAWKAGADTFTIWSTDANGNYIANIIPDTSGSSRALELVEATFQQDLNGDGVIGLKTTVIEANGAPRLDQVANNYFLDPAGGGQGPTLKYQGVDVVAGSILSSSGVWSPIAAEQTATGYVVAWKDSGADQYVIWITDSNGNKVSNGGNGGIMTAASGDLESAETTFHQDLNGDGHIGLVTVMESSGATRLDQFGSNYFLDPVSGGAGPSLKYQGAAVTAGQFGSWTPLGAEQTATGYEVAWKVNGADQYQIWTTDSNGNYVTQGSAMTAASIVLQAAEVRFHQDLNGDGRIGVAPTVVEASGATKLDLAGATYSLDPAAGGAGPTLKYQGAAVTPGQFGSWTAIGAEQTASGYEIAWKVNGADQYEIWNTDGNGNYVSQGSALTGASLALETAETSFHQDLNGDGIIGVPAHSAAIVSPPASSLTADSFVFRPDLGTNSTMTSADLSSSESHTSSAIMLPDLASNGPAAGLETLIPEGGGLSMDHSQSDPLHHFADAHSGVLVH
jgi:serralysin